MDKILVRISWQSSTIHRESELLQRETLALPYLSNLRKDYGDFFWNTYNEGYGEKSWKIRFVFSIAWKSRWLSINICLAFAFKEGKPFNIFLWCSESKHNSDKLVHGNRKLRRARKQHPQGKKKKKKNAAFRAASFLFLLLSETSDLLQPSRLGAKIKGPSEGNQNTQTK